MLGYQGLLASARCRTLGERTVLLWCVLVNPAAVVIDHGHFQYNCISLGLALGGAACIALNRRLLGKGMLTWRGPVSRVLLLHLYCCATPCRVCPVCCLDQPQTDVHVLCPCILRTSAGLDSPGERMGAAGDASRLPGHCCHPVLCPLMGSIPGFLGRRAGGKCSWTPLVRWLGRLHMPHPSLCPGLVPARAAPPGALRGLRGELLVHLEPASQVVPTTQPAAACQGMHSGDPPGRPPLHGASGGVVQGSPTGSLPRSTAGADVTRRAAQVLRPSRLGLLYCMAGSAFAFFLFSYQVHEKSILLPLLPVTMLAPWEPFVALAFPLVAMLSMLPLLEKDGLVVPYYALMVVFASTASAGHGFGGSNGGSGSTWRRVYFLATAAGGILLHMLRLMVPPPPRLPFLHDALVTGFAFAHFAGFFIYLVYRQWQLDPPGGATKVKAQ